jgi:tRNA pseudouridine38-40 synthase
MHAADDGPLQHWALGLEYDGRDFHGWQRQAGQISVQQVAEEALAQVADHSLRVVASGRTDAGVHATSQVISFATRAERAAEAWVRGVTSLTPATLTVLWARRVPAEFSARFSATARRYQYVILESAVRPALAAGLCTWSRVTLDDSTMHRAAQVLIGEHDFSSFRAASCQSRSAQRCVHTLSVQRFGALVVIDIVANAFLQHMVRNIAGALLKIGAGQERPAWLAEVLRARSRPVAGPTAPPDGLYLVEVRYAAEFDLPRGRPPPMLGALGDIW